jgi:DNA replication protein DnaC
MTTQSSQQLLDEVVGLTKRLRIPYLRKAAPDVLATAKAQRWDPAEALRVLLEEEAKGRDAATIAARRRRAEFPTGKTLDTWRESASSIPARNPAGPAQPRVDPTGREPRGRRTLRHRQITSARSAR